MNIPAKVQTASRGSFHLVRTWGPAFMMAGITILSSGSSLPTGPVSFVGMDKLGHFVVFGLLAIAWARIPNRRRYNALPCWALAVCLTTLFGLLDEWHQLYTPGRFFEWADLLANFLGAVTSAAIYLWVPGIQRVMEHKFCQNPHLISTYKETDSAG